MKPLARLSTWIWAAPAAVALSVSGPSALGQDERGAARSSPRVEYRTAPGEGVLCAMMMYNALHEVGRRCFPGEHPRFQAELQRRVEALDDYTLKNSKVMTSADLLRFKERHALVSRPTAELCKGEVPRLYKSAAAKDRKGYSEEFDSLVARPGEPSFGHCL